MLLCVTEQIRWIMFFSASSTLRRLAFRGNGEALWFCCCGWLLCACAAAGWAFDASGFSSLAGVVDGNSTISTEESFGGAEVAVSFRGDSADIHTSVKECQVREHMDLWELSRLSAQTAFPTAVPREEEQEHDRQAGSRFRKGLQRAHICSRLYSTVAITIIFSSYQERMHAFRLHITGPSIPQFVYFMERWLPPVARKRGFSCRRRRLTGEITRSGLSLTVCSSSDVCKLISSLFLSFFFALPPAPPDSSEIVSILVCEFK